MYNEFFGLQKAPFSLTPDPEFLYLTTKPREALAALTYGILARILGHLPESRIRSSVIVIPTLTPAEFLEAALMDFGFQNIPASKAQRIAILQSFLWTEY